MSPRAALGLALCLPLLAGCPPSSDDDGPSTLEAQYCNAGEGADGVERSLEIGGLDGHAFVPWGDGTEVALETGGQGGTMVVVSLRVPRVDGDPDQACWVVTLDNELAGSGDVEVSDFKAAYVFHRSGEHMQVDGLFDLLGYGSDGLAGNVLTLNAIIDAEGFGAEHTVDVTLR